MAQESIDDYLKQIFSNRRYCSNCGAMTPILSNDDWTNINRYPTSGVSIPVGPTCECCKQLYQTLPFHKLRIKETYGIAIINNKAVNLSDL